MSNPYLIKGPAKISFSGGRTSGLMLWNVLQAHGGRLPDDVHVLFANTGKERPETLDFIHEIETRWRVDVVWVERADNDAGFIEVNHKTAARDGAPFAQLIRERNFLPNPVTRFCTQELKIRVMKAWMLARGYEHWTNVVGLRADEPRRVSRIRASNEKDRWDVSLPLSDAGVSVADVDAFWAAQPFDLGLRKWEGNCDLCFLKGRAKRTRIMRDNPGSPDWWIDMEHIVFAPGAPRDTKIKVVEHVEDPVSPTLPFGAEFLKRVIEPKPQRGDAQGSFRYDAPSYEDLFTISQQPMFAFDESELDGIAIDDIDDCVCNAA